MAMSEVPTDLDATTGSDVATDLDAATDSEAAANSEEEPLIASNSINDLKANIAKLQQDLVQEQELETAHKGQGGTHECASASTLGECQHLVCGLSSLCQNMLTGSLEIQSHVNKQFYTCSQ